MKVKVKSGCRGYYGVESGGKGARVYTEGQAFTLRPRKGLKAEIKPVIDPKTGKTRKTEDGRDIVAPTGRMIEHTFTAQEQFADTWMELVSESPRKPGRPRKVDAESTDVEGTALEAADTQ